VSAFVLFTLAAVVTNVVFFIAADTALRRAVKSKRLWSPIAVAALCALSLLQALVLCRIPIAQAAVTFPIVACLGASALTDAAAGLVLDAVTFPTLTAAAVLSAGAGSFVESATGALSGALVVLGLYVFSKGRGIGLGDAKLAACAGAALGPLHELLSMGCAFVLGGAVAGLLLVTRRGDRKTPVAFAPYLAAGAFAVLAFRNA
jgi:leader peptidase (prepilin peptidase)/N-methyltransferase